MQYTHLCVRSLLSLRFPPFVFKISAQPFLDRKIEESLRRWRFFDALCLENQIESFSLGLLTKSPVSCQGGTDYIVTFGRHSV